MASQIHGVVLVKELVENKIILVLTKKKKGLLNTFSIS